MRTTVTVDRDVERLLREAMRQSGQTFKVTLNEAIRRGLVGTLPTVTEEPYVVSPQSMGLRAGIDPTKLQELGDDLEVDAFLDLTRKLVDAAKESA